MRKKIDVENWNRKLAYDTFEDYSDPYTGLVTKIDVTNIVNFCKANNLSFYGCMIYFVLKSMDEIDDFKYGYGKENNTFFVYKYDTLAVIATILDNNNELKFTRYVEYDKNILKFLYDFSNAKKDAVNNIENYRIPNLQNMNKVYVTCIPWISFSNFKDAVDLKEKNSKPKVCWGKYYFENGKYLLDISLLVNHAFQDGYHIGLFFNYLQKNIYSIEIEKNNIKVR